MTDDEAKLERQLRDATGLASDHDLAAQPDHDTSDPESAALAEGWHALGQLVAAAEADFRPDVVLWQLRRRRFRERMWRGGALAAAAVFLIGVGLAWYQNHGGVPNERPNQPSVAYTDTGKAPALANSKTNDAISKPNSVATSAAASIGWDQSLDQQISEAGQIVQNAKTLSDASDDLIDQLDKQLVSFRQEVEANSL
jgi:hypothetical protein